MVPQEFYIRSASETEARGPYNLEQVQSLVEAGQVSPETLYYDAGTEKWVAISDDAEVRLAVFPEKKKLLVKREVKVATLNKEQEGDAPITVNEMLAAAEGKTHDTRDKSAVATAMDRCAKIGMWSLVAGLFLAAAGEIIPAADVLTDFAPAKLLDFPLIFLGALDLVLALLLILGVISIYPLIRFRAALGLGFVGLIFLSQGLPTGLIAVTAGCIGLYCSTIFVSYVPTAISAGLAVVGMGMFAWSALNT